MVKQGTTEKLAAIKEVMATSFTLATEASIEQGLQFKYTSKPIEDEDQSGWIVEIIVKEAGYGERTIQTFAYQRPKNIDTKNMEYNVLVNVLSTIIQTSLLTWYETAKFLATDLTMQEKIRNGETSIISSDK